MDQIPARQHEKQAQYSQTQKEHRAVWRHVRPWQFLADGQGRKHRQVCWQERRLAKIIASYASKSGYCWASVKTLADNMGLSTAQTARYLARLRKQGIIVAEGSWHKHGTRIRTLNPAGLASEPVRSIGRPCINSFGIKKGMSYRPAYAPVRECKSPTVRECESSTCANVRDKSFLRESRAVVQRKYAVPEKPTCELPLAGAKRLPGKPRDTESRPNDRRVTRLQEKPLSQNLLIYMEHNGFESVAEFLRYNPKRWGDRKDWEAKVEECIRMWEGACGSLGYEVDFRDPCLCWDFLAIVEEEVQKGLYRETTPARVCMKILDKCQSATPLVPFPPAFLAYKNRLYRAEKLGV